MTGLLRDLGSLIFGRHLQISIAALWGWSTLSVLIWRWSKTIGKTIGTALGRRIRSTRLQRAATRAQRRPARPTGPPRP